MRRALIPFLVAAVAAAVLAGAAQARPTEAGTYAYGARANAATVAARLAQAPSGFTGGPVTASDGETVNVFVQDSLLAADPATGKHWADVLAGLLHGPELSTVTVYIGTLDRVQQTCGSGALGCYGGNKLIAIGQDLPGVTAQSVVTHEYGHHVADSRANDPWSAVDWGTKRWATYENVCSRAKAGELAPGDESSRYTENPGEAFAEDYRVLNERRAGVPESPWDVVDQSLYPDQTALDLLALDVTTPWTANTATTYRSVLTLRSTGRGFRIATPLDGDVTVTLTSPAKTSFTLRIVDPATGGQIAVAPGTARVKTMQTSVCGQRSVQVQVHRVRGSGAFTLAVSKP